MCYRYRWPWRSEEGVGSKEAVHLFYVSLIFSCLFSKILLKFLNHLTSCVDSYWTGKITSYVLSTTSPYHTVLSVPNSCLIFISAPGSFEDQEFQMFGEDLLTWVLIPTSHVKTAGRVTYWEGKTGGSQRFTERPWIQI